MTLIIGLGNPGTSFARTRHNIGRAATEAFGKHAGFAAFHSEKKWRAEVSEGKIGKEKVILLLPDTFMNKSGFAAGKAARFYQVKHERVFIVHDDADLPLGKGKLSFGRNSAGHKGVESVMRAFKTKKFWRLRIGIAGNRNITAEKLVLNAFSPTEQRIAKKSIAAAGDALLSALIKSPEAAMNIYNSR